MIQLKVTPVFPSVVKTDNFVTISKAAGSWTISVDYTILDTAPTSSPSQTFVAVLDAVSGSYKLMPISEIISGSGTGGIRTVTEAGDIIVGPNVRVLVMNRTVDESPSKIYLPAAAVKVGDIKIVDWKANSGSFPHDVYLTGAEKFNGNQSVWHVNGDGASAALDPVPSLGYAV